MNIGTHQVTPAGAHDVDEEQPHHAERGRVRQQDGQDQVDRRHQGPQQQQQHHEDAAQHEDEGLGHVAVGGVAQIEEHGRVAFDVRRRLRSSLKVLSMLCTARDGFRAVGTRVEHHLEPGGGAVGGEVGVAERLQALRCSCR